VKSKIDLSVHKEVQNCLQCSQFKNCLFLFETFWGKNKVVRTFTPCLTNKNSLTSVNFPKLVFEFWQFYKKNSSKTPKERRYGWGVSYVFKQMFCFFNSCFFYLKRFVSNKKTTNFCFLDLQFSKHFFFNFQFNSIALQECLRVFNTLHPFWTFYLIAVMAFCCFFWKLGAHQNLCDVICPYLKIVIFRCAIFCGIQQKSRY
jgi:hypothetical protein